MCPLWNVLFLFRLCVARSEIRSSHEEELIGRGSMMYQLSAVPGSFTRKSAEGASGDSWIRTPRRVAGDEDCQDAVKEAGDESQLDNA